MVTNDSKCFNEYGGEQAPSDTAQIGLDVPTEAPASCGGLSALSHDL
jgi:hypothetical protein